ncbi:MAG: cytochrome bc complex cytochrome b subunit [Candidatus Aminicenantia bacterium]
MKEKRKKQTFLEWLNDQIDLKEILSWLTFTGFIYGPLDRRLEIKEALQKMLKKPVPKHVNHWFCFGGITFLLFMIQVITGTLLAIYYKPTAHDAYASVQHIMNDVTLGWLIRQIHAWGANLMILTLIIHMLRVFFYGAYKHPRELNWTIGVLLLLLTLTFGFTGYLLPWDQLAYWATTVGTELIGSFPLVGQYILIILRGGTDVTEVTLNRFYAVHVIILPWVTAGLMALHFIMVRRQGISGPL